MRTLINNNRVLLFVMLLGAGTIELCAKRILYPIQVPDKKEKKDKQDNKAPKKEPKIDIPYVAGNFYIEQETGIIYLAAHSDGSQHYALSSINEHVQYQRPHTPSNAIINNLIEQTSPLFDKSFCLLSSLKNQLFAVLRDEPTSLYLVVNDSKGCHIHKKEILYDSDGQPAGDIVCLTPMNNNYMAAAVKGHGQSSFGTNGSGIALCVPKVEKSNPPASKEQSNTANNQPTSEIITYSLTQLDANPTEEKSSPNPRAYPLNNTLDCIAIEKAALCFADAIDIYWDNQLDLLFIGLDVTTACHAGAGARSVVIGRIENEKLYLRPIVTGQDLYEPGIFDIVVGISDGVSPTRVAAHHVRTLQTSTNEHYLIVQGGVGQPDTTQRSVYALPMHDMRIKQKYVRTSALKKHGTLQRTRDQAALCVGGGPLKNGSIEHIIASNDRVYAVVKHADVGYCPGIFYSHALFNQDGSIASWTAWKRAAPCIDPIQCALPTKRGCVLYTSLDQHNHSINAVTQWTDHEEQTGLLSLNSVIDKAITSKGHSITHCRADSIHDHGYLFITGYDSAIVAHVSQTEGNDVIAYQGQYDKNIAHISKNIVLSTGSDAHTALVDKTILEPIAPLTSACLCVNQQCTKPMLAFGASRGLAIVAIHGDDQDRSSAVWNNTNTTTTIYCDTSIKNIRKLVYDDHFLYVITDDTLKRIDLNTLSEQQPLSSTCLADKQTELGILYDAIISDKLVLLATSTGLWRTGNNANAQTAGDDHAMNWTAVTLPEGMPIVTQLCATTYTGNERDVARYYGGMVYALQSYKGKDIGLIHRLSIKSDEEINDQTVCALHDHVAYKTLDTYYKNLHRCPDAILMHGNLLLQSFNKSSTHKALILDGIALGKPKPFIKLPDDVDTITNMFIEPISGSIIIATNCCLLINQ